MSNETLTVMVLILYMDKKDKKPFDKLAIGCMGIIAAIDMVQWIKDLIV